MLYPPELRCTFCAMLYLIDPPGTLLSYAAPYWATLYPLRCAARFWSKVHPAELHSTLTELRYWTTLNPTELCLTLLSYAVLYWATLSSTELRSTMWATLLPNWATLAHLCNLLNAGMPDCPVPEYRTEMLDAGIPIPRYAVKKIM